jgi:membrane protein
MGREAISAWMDDFAPSMGAALSYYTLFSLAPLLVVVIAIAGLVFGPEAARAALSGQMNELLGEAGAKVVDGLLAGASYRSTGLIATVIGTGTLLLGATSVFAELQTDLDRIWRAPAIKHYTVWMLLRSRLLTFGMVLAVGFLLLVSLVVSTALAAVGKWWGAYFGGWEVTLQVVNFGVSFVIITILFALLYKFLPRVHVSWRDVWIGAAATSALFTIGKSAIGIYIGKSNVASGFGAAGAIAVLLVWVYYSAQIFLLGAEFTWIFAHRRGSRAGQAT